MDDNNEDEDKHKSYFGFYKKFFMELFIPKGSAFKNNLYDITVEDCRFLSFPYFFDESHY